jgi:hypothetical protein
LHLNCGREGEDEGPSLQTLQRTLLIKYTAHYVENGHGEYSGTSGSAFHCLHVCLPSPVPLVSQFLSFIKISFPVQSDKTENCTVSEEW